MKKYRLVKQENIKDCGAAALASILTYYHGTIPFEKLREMTKTTKQGTTAYHIVEAAKQLGFESYGIKCSLEEIKHQPISLPAIVHTVINNSYKHFMVIYDIDEKQQKVIIADPMDKIKKMDFQEFKKIFQNIVIVMHPIKNIHTEKQSNHFVKMIKDSLKKEKKTISMILLFSAIYFVLNLLGMLFLKEMIYGKEIMLFFLISIGIEILKIGMEYIRMKNIITLDHHVTLQLTRMTIFQIIKLPYIFYRNKTTGEIISRINDLETIIKVCIYGMTTLVMDIVIMSAFGILLYFIQAQLFFVSLIIIILYLFVNIVFKGKLNRTLQQLKYEQDHISTLMFEIVSGFESIKGLNLEENFLRKFDESYQCYLTINEKLKKLYHIQKMIKDYILQNGFLVILLLGIIFVRKNTFTFEQLLIFYAILQYFLETWKHLFDYEQPCREALMSLKRLESLYYYQFKPYSDQRIEQIHTQQLTYSPNDAENILEDLTLHIHSRDKIMMIGKSGAGKSTLLKLIKKYYQTNQLYFNHEVSSKNKRILYVSQNEYLFTDTLYNNITLGRKIPVETVKQMMKLCHIEEIIKDQKIGYHMLIEENGFNISGGERQRIILARSLVSEFDVLLLDESLSEVDANLERIILKNIISQYQEKIILFVSHKKDNMDLFNKLWKCQNKKIEELKKEG